MTKKHFAFPRCVVALALASLSAAVFAQDVRTACIGQLGPTPGPVAHLANDNVNRARLAIADLNARGLRTGGRPVRFELLAEDDAADQSLS